MCCAAALVASSHPALAQESLDSSLEKAITEEMRATSAPGASIAIVREGRVVYMKAFGATSAEGGQPVTPATLFRIGSITKALTGIAALQLRDAGRLDFAAPIGRLAPELHASLASLTLEQLLTHTAGVGQEGSGNGSHDDSALAARVRRWGAEQLIGPPDDIYSYSSPGYWLTGYLLERATGERYADVMAKYVFEPLGMRRSTLRPLMALTYPLALDHRVGNDGVARVLRPFGDDASTWPGGSVFSSAEELARAAIALLDDGRIDGVQALARSTAQGMRSPRARQAAGGCSYSYGLSVCSRGSVATLSHYGFRSGSGAVFTLIPSRRAAIIILSNRNGGIFTRTEATALRLLAGADATDGDDDAPASSASLPRPDRFLGTFVNGPDSLRVAMRDSKLFFRYGTDEQPMRVMADSAISIVDSSGTEQQRFLLKRGRRSGAVYLHDGISAYKRVERGKARGARSGEWGAGSGERGARAETELIRCAAASRSPLPAPRSGMAVAPLLLMAEGHAVARWAMQLRALVGEELLSVRSPARWRERAERLVGTRLQEVRTAGKHLMLDLGEYVIHCHAMQYGSWQVGQPGMTLRKESRFVRLHLVTPAHEAAYYHGPVMEILTGHELATHGALIALGPDLLHESFDRHEVARRMRAAGARALGDAVLDQRIVAGIGNIYKSEGLFLAHLDPRRSARSVTAGELDDLWEVLIPLMRAGIAGFGRTTTLPADLLGNGQFNWAYRRRGQPCLRCGGTIAMLRQGELARATYFCPECQA